LPRRRVTTLCCRYDAVSLHDNDSVRGAREGVTFARLVSETGTGKHADVFVEDCTVDASTRANHNARHQNGIDYFCSSMDANAF